MEAVTAGRKATDQDGGAEKADEGAFDPGFHDSVSYLKKGLNMAAMVPGSSDGVLSARYRFVSVCFRHLRANKADA
jgi:hypothetical protein